jgi:hypothetical protein
MDPESSSAIIKAGFVGVVKNRGSLEISNVA